MLWVSRSKQKKIGLLLDRSLDNDEQCRACDGVCCRSFCSVALSWEEYEKLKALGAQRLHFSLRGRHQLMIENGCEFLVTGKCAVYESRPEICRRFSCKDG